MKIKYIILLAATVALGSCNIYKPYSRPEVNTEGLYRDPRSAVDTLAGDTVSMGNLPWREVFTDPMLQGYIELALAQNVDLQSAMLTVEQARASLYSARWAYSPSLNLAPQGGVNSFDNQRRTFTWSATATASWEIDLFGRLLNAKRGAKAQLQQSEAYLQATQASVIDAVATYYYTLLMLDSQLELTRETAKIWDQTVETMRALKEAGMTNEAAVVQSEANSYMLKATIPDLEQSVRETENALCIFLKIAPQQLERGKLADQRLPERLDAGIPVQLLANRPDVKAAEMALAQAWYTTNEARSAFYPSLSLSGTWGWTNQAGNVILNPGKMIAQAVAGLTAPIFNKGANTARLRAAKAAQQQSLLAFEQTLLQAGSEVSNALYKYECAQQKMKERAGQIEALEKSVKYTEALFNLGTSTYLEILTAQQSLLSARLSDIADQNQKMMAVVDLYHALGGGRDQ